MYNIYTKWDAHSIVHLSAKFSLITILAGSLILLHLIRYLLEIFEWLMSIIQHSMSFIALCYIVLEA